MSRWRSSRSGSMKRIDHGTDKVPCGRQQPRRARSGDGDPHARCRGQPDAADARSAPAILADRAALCRFRPLGAEGIFLRDEVLRRPSCPVEARHGVDGAAPRAQCRRTRRRQRDRLREDPAGHRRGAGHSADSRPRPGVLPRAAHAGRCDQTQGRDQELETGRGAGRRTGGLARRGKPGQGRRFGHPRRNGQAIDRRLLRCDGGRVDRKPSPTTAPASSPAAAWSSLRLRRSAHC